MYVCIPFVIKLVDIRDEIDRRCVEQEKRNHRMTERKKRKLSRVWTILITLIIRLYTLTISHKRYRCDVIINPEFCLIFFFFSQRIDDYFLFQFYECEYPLMMF